MRERIGGILLDGGRGARLAAAGLLPPGGKGAIVIDGATLAERALAALRAVAGHTVVVAAPGRIAVPTAPDTRAVPDSLPGAGPLAAIADGLEALTAWQGETIGTVVVLACDLPLVRPALLAFLVERLAVAPEVDWVVPLVADHPQVLASALRPRLGAAVRAAVEGGVRSPRVLAARVSAGRPGSVDLVPEAILRGIDPGLGSLRDVDTPADLDAMRRILGESPET